MTRHIGNILFALIPLTFLLLQQPSSAALEGEACSLEPTNMIIDYGDLITCSISPTGDTDTFRFTGSAGDTVDVSVSRRSGGDPCVELFNPQGGRLGGTCTSFVSKVRVTLTSTGVHTILVSELNGDATLDYTLSLERLAPPSPPAKPIFFGDLITDEINPSGDNDLYQFPGQAGEAIDISVSRQGGGDPCVELFNPQGGRLGGTCTSFVSKVRVTLTSTGVHTILVSELNGDATLDYTLSLERLAPPSPPAKPIFYGQSILDEINPPGDQDLYYFYGSDGDTIEISVARQSGGDSCVELFNPQGGRLGGTCTSFVSTVRVTLTSTGVQTILVSELNGDATLAYTISLQCLSGMCQPPPSSTDLSLIKTDCPDPAGADSTLTYKITVANSGPDPATSVMVTDILPTLTAFVSCSSTGGVCGGSGNNRIVSFNSLAVGASETITLIAVVNATAPDGIVLSNTAEVSSALFDPNLNNNAATATTTVGMTQMPGSLQFSAPSYSVNEGGGNATITTTRTGGSDGAVSVNYATANGTATADSDYTAASGTLTFADGETSKSFTVPITNDSLDEPDETVNLTLSAPTGCATLGSPAAAVLTILDDDPPTLQLSSASYIIGEGAGSATIPVARTGSSSGAAAVDYKTSDTAGLTNCNVVNGVASSRCDYATSVGTVRFDPGQTSKNIFIPLVDDSYAEGNENFTITLSNATGAILGAPNTATVTINDNEATNGPNPIDGTAFFVRQHYIDFLGREPDPPGFAAWQAVINNCPPGDTTCDRIHVSSAFFRSPEFQERGYFVYRFYSVALGRKPDYTEFMPDIARVSGFLSDVELEAAKVAFIDDFMARSAFTNVYDSLNNTQYVDTLLSTAGITHGSRDFWIASLTNGTKTRAQVLREIAESTEVFNKYFNQAFVVMQYFGYLRRDPDALYLNWIAHLDSTSDYRSMINGFMNSLEYRFRFGP